MTVCYLLSSFPLPLSRLQRPGGIDEEPEPAPETLVDPDIALLPDAVVQPFVAQSELLEPLPWHEPDDVLLDARLLLFATQPPEALLLDVEPPPPPALNETPRSSAESGAPGMRSGEHEAIAATSATTAAPTARPAFM